MKRRSPRVRSFCGALLAAFGLGACASDSGPTEPISTAGEPASVGGCTCPSSGNCAALSFSDIPADGVFYITTFGGGADTQSMSCGGTADGTWPYVADSARFGCNAKLLIEAQGKACVAEVRDCGPNRCVEQAACSCSCGDHFPIIDASPFITNYLLGTGSVGWSEKKSVKVTQVDSATPTGCPGGTITPADSGAGGAAGSGGGAGASGQAGMPSGGAGGSGGGAGTGSGAAGASAGASTGATGGGKPGGSSDSEGGCSCSVERRAAPAWAGFLALLGLGLALESRQKRRRRGFGRLEKNVGPH